MQAPDTGVSIIITTRNRAEHLKQTLVSMEAVLVPDGIFAEILVVDNGSTDGTAEVAHSIRLPNLTIRYVNEPAPGQSRARNRGIAETRSRMILFTDDDVRPRPDWLSGMAQPVLSGAAMAVAGGVVLAGSIVLPWMTEFHRGLLAETQRINQENPAEFVGANMGFARQVVENVPAYDVELGPGALGFADDTLFARQIISAGYRITPAFSAVVDHHPDANRFSRNYYADHCNRLGRSYAYIAYHWEHEPDGGFLAWKFDQASQWNILRKRLEQRWLKFRKVQPWPYADGAPEYEMLSNIEIGYMQQYLEERGKPRLYERHGLTKKIVQS